MTNSTKILSAALLILGVLAYFFWPSTPVEEASYKTGNLSMSLDSGSIVKIAIEKSGKSVTLENQGGKWMVTSPVKYPAAMNSITQILGGMGKFKVGTLVSSNPEKQSMYEVDSAGTKLSVTDRAGKTVSMIVGKTGPSYTEVYFKTENSKDVYLGDGLTTFMLNQDVNNWRDKAIYSIARDSVKKLDYFVLGKNFTFEKDLGTLQWRQGTDSVDMIAINSTLGTLSGFQCEDFADTIGKPETEPMSVKVSSAADEAVISMYPILPDSSRYYVQTSKSSQFFIVGKFNIQQLTKPIEKLLTPQKSQKKK